MPKKINYDNFIKYKYQRKEIIDEVYSTLFFTKNDLIKIKAEIRRSRKYEELYKRISNKRIRMCEHYLDRITLFLKTKLLNKELVLETTFTFWVEKNGEVKFYKEYCQMLSFNKIVFRSGNGREFNEKIPYWSFWYKDKSGLMSYDKMFKNNKKIIIDNIKIESLLETAIKENWTMLYRQLDHTKSNYLHKWRLKDFSHAEIHKLKSFLKDESLLLYRDYIEQDVQNKHGYSHTEYFLHNWKEIHNQNILERLRISNEEKEKQKAIFNERIKSALKHKLITLPKPQSLQDLEAIGREMHNCIGKYHKDPTPIYMFAINNLKIAVSWNGKTISQAYFMQNIPLPDEIYEKVKMAMETITKANQGREQKNGI